MPRGFGPGALAAEVAAGPGAEEVTAGPWTAEVTAWPGLCGEIGTAHPAFAVPNVFS